MLEERAKANHAGAITDEVVTMECLDRIDPNDPSWILSETTG
jgi:hypothetical protein